jgi:hypothetical protein
MTAAASAALSAAPILANAPADEATISGTTSRYGIAVSSAVGPITGRKRDYRGPIV